MGGRPFLVSQFFFWPEGSFKYDSGEGFRGRCIGDNENGISAVNPDFVAKIKRDVVGVLIAHVGDLLVSGTDAFIAYI